MAATSDDSRGKRGKRGSRSREEEDDDDDFQQLGDDSSDEGGSGDESYEVQTLAEPEQIQVDLELFNMESDDYFTVKHFLTNYLDGRAWLASDVARHLSDEMGAYIGSTIRIDGGRDPYGFLTVWNLHCTAHLAATREAVSFILSKVTQGSHNQQLKHILGGSEHMALLLNERMVNVPGQIAPPLHLGFWEELEEAAEEEIKRGEAKPYFNIEYYLLMTSIFEETSGDIPAHRSKKKGKPDDDIQYFKPEEEVYVRNSRFAFSYPLPKGKHGRWTIGGDVKERRLIVLIHKSAVPKIIEEMKEFARDPDFYRTRGAALDTTDPFVNPCAEESRDDE